MTSPSSELGPLVAALRGGGVVGVPTDTVYGLACDPAHPRAAAAIERIHAIKRRPDQMELGLLAAGLAQVEAVAELDGRARRLAAAFWPGPLSLIVPARRPRRLAVPRAGDSLSVRVPAHPLLGELLAGVGPLATTSANRHGEPPCADAACVAAGLGDELDAILDGGAAVGRGSTIIDLTQNPPRVLRVGPLSAEQLHPYLEG